MKARMFIYFRVCKGLSSDDVRGARGTVFQELVTAGSWFRNRRFC